jgi:hypothetical protein
LQHECQYEYNKVKEEESKKDFSLLIDMIVNEPDQNDHGPGVNQKTNEKNFIKKRLYFHESEIIILPGDSLNLIKFTHCQKYYKLVYLAICRQ